MVRHKSTIDPAIDESLLVAVREADEVLDQVLGEPAARVSAEWLPGPAGPSASTLLRLTDAEVTRSREFTLPELRVGRPLRYDLRDVWRDVLQERYRNQYQRVLESLATGDGE